MAIHLKITRSSTLQYEVVDSISLTLNDHCQQINKAVLHPDGVYNFFIETNLKDPEYDSFVSIGDLFRVQASAIATSNDDELVSFTESNEHNHEFFYRPFDVRYVNYDLDKVKGNRYNKLVKYLMSSGRDLGV